MASTMIDQEYCRNLLNQLLFPIGMRAVVIPVERTVRVYIYGDDPLKPFGAENRWEFKVLDLEDWPYLIMYTEDGVNKLYEMVHHIMVWEFGDGE